MQNITFTGETGIIGRVGTSPSGSGQAIYMPLINHMKLDLLYLQFTIDEDSIKDYLAAVKTMNFLGGPVTGPHTHSLMELVDEIDETAVKTNHGNCLVNKDGKTSLHSTDVTGMMNILLPLVNNDFSDKEVVILGSGALVPGILNELNKNTPKKVTLYNRTVSKSEIIAKEYNCEVGGNIEEMISTAKGDVFINLTHIGMHKCETKDDIFTDEFLQRFKYAQDVTYLPAVSSWTKRAAALGLSVGYGFEMFAEQGAQQLRLIANIEPDMDFMTPLVKKGLGD